MNKDYLDRIIKRENPWFFEENSKMSIVISDDCDSLFSFILLKNFRPQWQIGYFYDFRQGLFERLDIDKSLPLVGIDLSHPGNMRCISNHVCRIRPNDRVNPNDINLSNIDGISVKNYHSKYNLNTFLLCASLLDFPLKEKNQTVLSLLFDSAFLAHYSKIEYQDWKIQRKYLVDILELPEVYEVQKDIKKHQFQECQEILGIKSKLWCTDYGIEPVDNVDIGLICRNLGLEYDPNWLKGMFGMIKKSKAYQGSTYTDWDYDKDDPNLWSFAVVSKSKVKYSRLCD